MLIGLIAAGIGVVVFLFLIWIFCKAASNADKQRGYDKWDDID